MSASAHVGFDCVAARTDVSIPPAMFRKSPMLANDGGRRGKRSMLRRVSSSFDTIAGRRPMRSSPVLRFGDSHQNRARQAIADLLPHVVIFVRKTRGIGSVCGAILWAAEI